MTNKYYNNTVEYPDPTRLAGEIAKLGQLCKGLNRNIPAATSTGSVLGRGMFGGGQAPLASASSFDTPELAS